MNDLKTWTIVLVTWLKMAFAKQMRRVTKLHSSVSLLYFWIFNDLCFNFMSCCCVLLFHQIFIILGQSGWWCNLALKLSDFYIILLCSFLTFQGAISSTSSLLNHSLQIVSHPPIIRIGQLEWNGHRAGDRAIAPKQLFLTSFKLI